VGVTPSLDGSLTGPGDDVVVLIILFAYAFLSNVALAVVPHEPVVVWYGQESGVWPTALVATAGTLVASWVDYRAFGNLVSRLAQRTSATPLWIGTIRRMFGRAPFAVLAFSGLTPLPFFPFKALAFAESYPLGRYLAAVAIGRLPRYALLAWLGYSFRLPAWPFIAFTSLLFLPSLRRLIWPRPSAS
jgi:membrane protein YqaA with SNARE-associated domain